MTIKQQLHRVIDELDDEHAGDVLAFALRASSRNRDPATSVLGGPEAGVDVDRESLWHLARPVTAADPLWRIVGLLGDDGPPDMSADKHRYLADSYGDLHDE